PPNEIVALLADYRQHMVAEIFAHGGTLDKFIGDGILAVFGTFGPTTDTADRAFSTARDMFRALEQMNARRRAVGLPPLRHRAGLHAGPALVGNVEAAGRMEFTAVGEAVNVASRIEQAGKALGEGLLISAAVCAQLSDSSPCRSLGLVDLPGYAPVELYAVRDRASA